MIHPTAIIDANAKLASDVEVGAYTVIGPKVEIGAGTKIGPHIVIQGPCKIGKNNRILQFYGVVLPWQNVAAGHRRYHQDERLR